MTELEDKYRALCLQFMSNQSHWEDQRAQYRRLVSEALMDREVEGTYAAEVLGDLLRMLEDKQDD